MKVTRIASGSVQGFGKNKYVVPIAYRFAHLGFYTNVLNLVKGSTILYTGFQQGANYAANLSGTGYADLDNNLDQWDINQSGVVSWYMISAYSLNGLGNYSADPVIINGWTELRDSAGTGSTILTGISGLFDQSNFWSTNESGTVSWTASLTGRHFWVSPLVTNQAEWITITNWWWDNRHTLQAIMLPNILTHAIVDSGSVAPSANLDSEYWVQPLSIDVGTSGIVFQSELSAAVTCTVTVSAPAEAKFVGSATYNTPAI